MLNRTLRVEAATDERPAERERLRGIKRDDSIIRSSARSFQWCRLRTWPAVCSIPRARPFALDGAMFVDNGLPGRLAFAVLSLLVVASALKALMKSFHGTV